MPAGRLAAAFCLYAAVAAGHCGEIALWSGELILIEAATAGSPRAQAAAAEQSLAAGSAVEAERLAAEALRGMPLSAQSLRTLALARLAQGRDREAEEAMALAAGLGWRDTPTQLWLIDAYLREGAVDAAFERADALARRNRYRDEMIALFVAAAERPDGRAAVAARLRHGPPWSRAFRERWRGGRD